MIGTKRNSYIKNPYIRSLMADELLGVRHYFRIAHPNEEVKYWMKYEVYNCFSRMDQHLQKFGTDILTGESKGAF